mmetsp:Transcript_59253/g.144867  ORF Transcript_59253/g.144867 Transcript_59253/m.144867 type:complete len:205 (-) Transcript_59253:1016-1630(-)
MYFLYSLMVVAPIQRSCPRANAGFNKLLASIEPCAAPAPTTVCISSMKRMISPSLFVTSSRTAFKRSSNSPLMEAPATSAAKSNPINRHPFRVSGTSPETIRWAIPSATAVLPTPGSPISTGLFFVRRLKIWIVRRTSSSLPITGSNFPSAAFSVKSTPYFNKASYIFSAARLIIGPDFSRICLTTSLTSLNLTSCLSKALVVN